MAGDHLEKSDRPNKRQKTTDERATTGETQNGNLHALRLLIQTRRKTRIVKASEITIIMSTKRMPSGLLSGHPQTPRKATYVTL